MPEPHVVLPAPKVAAIRFQAVLYILLSLKMLAGNPANAATLKPEAVQGWSRYVAITEARIEREQTNPSHFLWIDLMPDEQKKSAETRLSRGQVIIERLQTNDEGAPIKTPGALIHHWIGLAFIRGATLKQALALVQDYNNHHNVYKPEVERSELISRDGDDFKIFLRYRKKKIITVVLNTYHDVHYHVLDPQHAHCRSYTTRLTEVENPGTSQEHERSPEDQNGFMWRMNTYWRFEERNGGVYLQCEAITLTRSVPFALRWLIEPYITSIPHESLTETMNHTRDALATSASQVQNFH
jgi:hypothetical protein